MSADNIHNVILALLLAAAMLFSASAAATPEDDDTVIAQSLAEMLRAARTMVSDNQDLINNPDLGDKHLTGKVVLEQAAAIYAKDTGVDPATIDQKTRHGRLLHAMMAAIGQVMEENQVTINREGTGFKGFIPSAFARLVDEAFTDLAKGEAGAKVTAPPELIRYRKARPDAWEAAIIQTKLLDPTWPKGQSYSDTVETNGRPAFRFMVPEYYSASCLACHGSPKGEMDITGNPKEGGKLSDLGAVISITLYH